MQQQFVNKGLHAVAVCSFIKGISSIARRRLFVYCGFKEVLLVFSKRTFILNSSLHGSHARSVLVSDGKRKGNLSKSSFLDMPAGTRLLK